MSKKFSYALQNFSKIEISKPGLRNFLKNGPTLNCYSIAIVILVMSSFPSENNLDSQFSVYIKVTQMMLLIRISKSSLAIIHHYIPSSTPLTYICPK